MPTASVATSKGKRLREPDETPTEDSSTVSDQPKRRSHGSKSGDPDSPQWFVDYLVRFTAMESRMGRKFTSLERSMSALLSHSPQAALRRYRRAVVPTDPNLRSQFKLNREVKDGAMATWTVIQFDDGWYAVGCRHCAAYYRTSSTHSSPLQFLSLPLALLQVGVEGAWFVASAKERGLWKQEKAMVDVEEDEAPWYRDFFAVKLSPMLAGPAQSPSCWPYISSDALPSWPNATVALNAATSAATFGGFSSSGPVLGEGPAVLHDGKLVFVMSAGEPGHSGTLMFALSDEGTPVPVGVFCGVATSLGPRMRSRGIIAPFPRDAFMKWSPVTTPPTTVTVSTATKTWEASPSPIHDAHNGYTVSGVNGIFIEHNSHYCGATVLANVRPQPPTI